MNGVREVEEPKDMPEGDIFEVVEAGSGEEFMAVKPWIGAVVEPTNRKFSTNFYLFLDNPPNPSPPSVSYTLDYVYGYRCEDSRQNVFINKEGNAVYMTAALGVILDPRTNTQRYFGGG